MIAFCQPQQVPFWSKAGIVHHADMGILRCLKRSAHDGLTIAKRAGFVRAIAGVIRPMLRAGAPAIRAAGVSLRVLAMGLDTLTATYLR